MAQTNGTNIDGVLRNTSKCQKKDNKNKVKIQYSFQEVL